MLSVDDWIEGYGRAWESGDDQAVGELFTHDAAKCPHNGRVSYIVDGPTTGRDNGGYLRAGTDQG